MGRFRDPERGASTLEYVAILTLSAVVLGAVLVAMPDVRARITDGVSTAVCQILGGQNCEVHGEDGRAFPDSGDGTEPDPLPTASPNRTPDPDSTWPHSEDAAPITSGTLTPEQSPLWVSPEGGFQHEEARRSQEDYLSLGQGRTGPCWRRPRGFPPRWERDPMCCPGRTCTTIREVRRSIRFARLACYRPGDQWAYCRPHAADMLDHFLGNTGEDVILDMDEFLTDLPEFQEEIERHQNLLVEKALADAEARGIDGPLTYPISTEKIGWGYPPDDIDGLSYVYEDPDWANAIGSFHYWLEGEITVYPPEEPGGEYTYSMDTTVQMEKYYDWDREWTDPVFSDWKRHAAGGYSQADLAELHHYGMAQEFWIRGTADMPTREG